MKKNKIIVIAIIFSISILTILLLVFNNKKSENTDEWDEIINQRNQERIERE